MVGATPAGAKPAGATPEGATPEGAKPASSRVIAPGVRPRCSARSFAAAAARTREAPI